MTVMAGRTDRTPWIFPAGMGVMPDDRRVISYSLIDVEIFPTVAVAAIHSARDRIARIGGRRVDGRKKDEQGERR
jgi:hypothetical protein